MSDTSAQNNNCCPKEIFYQEVKLWAIAYLRYKEKPKSHKINGKFENDIRLYKSIITKFVNDHSKEVKANLRVAFTRETLEFPGDLYVRLTIYLEHADPRRLPYFKRSAEAVPEANVAKNIQSDEVMSLQADAFGMGPGPVTPPRCPPDRPSLSVSEVAYVECGFQKL